MKPKLSNEQKNNVFVVARTEYGGYDFYALGDTEETAYNALKKTFIERWIRPQTTKEFLDFVGQTSLDRFLEYHGTWFYTLPLHGVGEIQ